MNDGGGRIISREGENCPGCLSPYSCDVGNSPSLVKRTARIIPGCSHNLCEICIEADGGSTGQVSCRHPGCSTKVAWTGGIEEFHINLFLLGSAVAYNQQILQSGQDGESEAIVASPEQQEDNCEMMCCECGEARAECLCQQCKTILCSKCFEKIHKNINIFQNHKPRPIANGFVGEKKEQYMKMSNCDEHQKMNMYIAEDGREGCDKCVIFGELKGLKVVTLEEVEEKTKKDLKENIIKGKEKLASLKSDLSDFELDKNEEIINSPENLAKKIKDHFSDCHSQLQTLENSIYQKLGKDQAKLIAWKADMETSVQSTESKIKQLADIVKISEEALEKVSNPGIYDFNEMMTVLSKLVDGPSEILRKSRPSSGNIKIEQGFVNLLKSHVTLSHNSEVELGPSSSFHVDDTLENGSSVPENLANQNVTENPSSESFAENLVGQSGNENVAGQSITEDLFSQSESEHSVYENAGETQSNRVAGPERNKAKYTTTKKLTFSKQVNDNGKKIDLAVHERKQIRKSSRVKLRPSHTKPTATIHKLSSRSKCAQSVGEKSQDGNNNANLCSGDHEADAQGIRNLRRKRISSPKYFESSDDDDDDKPPASKKVRKLKPSTDKCSKNVSDISYPNGNMIKIKPATSKKVVNERSEQSTSASKKSSRAIFPSQHKYKVSNDMRDCCKTKCKICNKTRSLSSMRYHTRGTHNLDITEYKKMYGPFNIIDVVYHKCEICEKIILLDNDYLASHLRSHSTRLKTYSNQNIVKRRDLNINKCKVNQKEDSICDSANQAEISLDEEQMKKNKTKKTRKRSQSRKNTSESSMKKSKPQEESEASIPQSQLSLEKSSESEDQVEITREIEAGDLKMTPMKVEIEDHGQLNIPSFTDDETTTTRRINVDDNADQGIIKVEPENEDGIIGSRSDIGQETWP